MLLIIPLCNTAVIIICYNCSEVPGSRDSHIWPTVTEQRVEDNSCAEQVK